jgi:large subunit ribosomal protein L30
VPEVIRKVTESAKRNLTRVALREGRTAAPRYLWPSWRWPCLPACRSVGTGIIAGGPMRAVFETLGVQDVVAKSKAAKTIKIEQAGGAIRRHHSQRSTLIGLKLNKIGRTAEPPDTPEVRGMIAKVQHIVRIVGDK